MEHSNQYIIPFRTLHLYFRLLHECVNKRWGRYSYQRLQYLDVDEIPKLPNKPNTFTQRLYNNQSSFETITVLHLAIYLSGQR